MICITANKVHQVQAYMVIINRLVKKYFLFLGVGMLLLLAGCNKPDKLNPEQHHHSKAVTNDNEARSRVLKVKGEVSNPLSLTVDSLKEMNVVSLDSFKVVCQSGADRSGNVWFKGVLLKDVLTKAKIIQQNHKDRNFYIVARATDNYKATFSWAEIFNNPTGESTYIVFEENGRPVPKGDFVLNTTNDIRTGPRHVYWLESIEVYKVE